MVQQIENKYQKCTTKCQLSTPKIARLSKASYNVVSSGKEINFPKFWLMLFAHWFIYCFNFSFICGETGNSYFKKKFPPKIFLKKLKKNFPQL